MVGFLLNTVVAQVAAVFGLLLNVHYLFSIWGGAILDPDLGLDALNGVCELCVKLDNLAVVDLNAFSLSKFKLKCLSYRMLMSLRLCSFSS